jgi:hypothetical protein
MLAYSWISYHFAREFLSNYDYSEEILISGCTTKYPLDPWQNLWSRVRATWPSFVFIESNIRISAVCQLDCRLCCPRFFRHDIVVSNKSPCDLCQVTAMISQDRNSLSDSRKNQKPITIYVIHSVIPLFQSLCLRLDVVYSTACLQRPVSIEWAPTIIESSKSHTITKWSAFFICNILPIHPS